MFTFNEIFLQKVWQYKLLYKNLVTTDGAIVEIINYGKFNTNEGPDFLNARIKIGSTEWVGHIEFHIKSSDYVKHKHANNPKYESLILHVVYENDCSINLNCPTLELKNYLSPTLLERYKFLIENKEVISCAPFLKNIDSITWVNWHERLLLEKWAAKKADWLSQLSLSLNNWEELFYWQIVRNFGFNINSLGFEMLAKQLPMNVLAKHKNNLKQTEALLFGVGGFLNTQPNIDYFKDLYTEWLFLQHKYLLTPIPFFIWNYSKLRPANFPEIRISQLAQLVHKSWHLSSTLIGLNKVSEIYPYFNIGVNTYFETHYKIGGAPSAHNTKRLSKGTIDNLICNTIAPYMYVYSEQNVHEELFTKALKWVQEIKAEKNSVTEKWAALGVHSKFAFESQALIYLYKNYCTQKKCLSCAIGIKCLQKLEVN